MRKARNSTVNIDHDQHALIRGAIRHVTKVTGRAYTLSQFVRDAFNNQLQLIWSDYNDGKPVPPDTAPLPTRAAAVSDGGVVDPTAAGAADKRGTTSTAEQPNAPR